MAWFGHRSPNLITNEGFELKRIWMKRGCALIFLASATLFGGCSATFKHTDPASPGLAQAWQAQTVVPNVQSVDVWQHVNFPGKKPTMYGYTRENGQIALTAQANSSASMLRLPVRVEPADLGLLRFSWLVPQLIEQADMTTRDADDAPVRVVLAFEGDRSKFSAKNAMLSDLSRAIFGEELPYATLMYVWCNKCPLASVITNSRTDRVRKLVIETGSAQLNQWLKYERDVKSDFERAFGEPAGALVGIAIMTDTDNTQSSAKALYGPLSLTSPAVTQGTIK